jgi:hypothetical protein
MFGSIVIDTIPKLDYQKFLLNQQHTLIHFGQIEGQCKKNSKTYFLISFICNLQIILIYQFKFRCRTYVNLSSLICIFNIVQTISFTTSFCIRDIILGKHIFQKPK